MKPARIIILCVALVAGGIAALLAGRSEKPAPAPQPLVEALETVDVLVAKADIAMGQIVTQAEMQWQKWPTAAASPSFIRRSNKPDAIEQLSGAIARTPFVTGEPMREAKLIKGTGAGFLAAILPSGMRAISTEISTDTSAGGFILPNDHVDVILTRRDRESERNGSADTHSSETILTNVKVLAIDQTIEEKEGQKVIVGPKTATLELAPRQAELIAAASKLGTLSLALRSLADANNNEVLEGGPDDGKNRRGISMVRYGITTNTTPK